MALDAIAFDSSITISRQTILERAKRYEQKTIATAEDYLTNNQWKEALDLYQTALDKYPSGQLLINQHKHILQQQQRILSEINLSFLIAKATWQHQFLIIQKLLLQTAPNNRDIQTEFKNASDTAQQLARKLTQLSKQAINRGDIQAASRALPAALSLLEGSDKEEAIQLEKILLTTMKKEQKAINKKHLAEQNISREKVEEAFVNNDLLTAKELLDKLPSNDPSAYHLRQQVMQAIDERVRLYISQGNALYSRGNYESAIEVWHEAKKLSPRNSQLISLLKRGQNVIQKLKQLEEKQQPN